MAQWFVEQKNKFKTTDSSTSFFFFSFGNSALFLCQHPQRQTEYYYYFCSPTFKKTSHSICFPLLLQTPLILKARMPYGANQTKKTEDLFKAVFLQVQAIISNSITGLRSSFCKPNGNSAVEIKLMSPRLKLEVHCPAKHDCRSWFRHTEIK